MLLCDVLSRGLWTSFSPQALNKIKVSPFLLEQVASCSLYDTQLGISDHVASFSLVYSLYFLNDISFFFTSIVTISHTWTRSSFEGFMDVSLTKFRRFNGGTKK